MKFAEIEARAIERHGEEGLAENVNQHKPKTKAALRKIPDDRWLSKFTEMIFKAGFAWKVIDTKWPGFEEAFKGFDVNACAHMDDEWVDALLKDTRIVRNPQKVMTVQPNAQMLLDLAAEHGSAAKFFADWPDTNYVGLLELLNKRGKRLGGTTAAIALRMMGRTSFITSKDVNAALIAAGVVDKEPKGKGPHFEPPSWKNWLTRHCGRWRPPK